MRVARSRGPDKPNNREPDGATRAKDSRIFELGTRARSNRGAIPIERRRRTFRPVRIFFARSNDGRFESNFETRSTRQGGGKQRAFSRRCCACFSREHCSRGSAPARSAHLRSRGRRSHSRVPAAMPLIYAFVARGPTVLAEHTSHSGNFATIAAEVRARASSRPRGSSSRERSAQTVPSRRFGSASPAAGADDAKRPGPSHQPRARVTPRSARARAVPPPSLSR